MWALVGSGLGIAALVAACYVARKRRLRHEKEKPAILSATTDLTLTSSADEPSELGSKYTAEI